MKKFAMITLSLVLITALFCGCRPNVGNETSAPTTEPTQATTQPTVPTTAPTTPSIVPTVPSTAPTNDSEMPSNGQTDGTTASGRVGRNGKVRP